MIQIKNRFTGAVIFEGEFALVKLAVEFAVGKKIDLRDAYLRGAYLVGADLHGADLHGANLVGADLVGANLRDADLCGADLRGADLVGADLVGADLCSADLHGADLRGANLRDADLFDADLHGAYLRGAYLRGEKLTKAPLQIIGLKWFVLITPQYMAVGCERHTHEEWAAFDDYAIAGMHDDALAFWKANREFLLAACKRHRESNNA